MLIFSSFVLEASLLYTDMHTAWEGLNIQMLSLFSQKMSNKLFGLVYNLKTNKL